MSSTYLWLLTLALSASTPTAQNCSESIGIVRLERHASADGILVKRCTAVLLTEDTVLLPASCFDYVRNSSGGLSRNDFDATFTPASAPEQTVLLDGFSIHPQFMPILCDRAEDNELCAQAESYCNHARVGMARDICLYDRASYARTYLQAPSQNLAVGYLVRALTLPAVAVLTPATSTLAAKEPLVLVHPVQPLFTSVAQRHTASEFVLANDEGMQQLPFACAAPQAQEALVGMPSHFTALPYASPLPIDRTFTRVDAALPWLDATLQQAYERGERVSDAKIARVATDVPATPEPPQAPGPKPMPVPEPVPEPKPEPVPEPEPELPGDVPERSGREGTQPPAQPVQAPAPPSDTQQDHAPLSPPEFVASPAARGCGNHGGQLYGLLLLPLCRRKRRPLI